MMNAAREQLRQLLIWSGTQPVLSTGSPQEVYFADTVLMAGPSLRSFLMIYSQRSGCSWRSERNASPLHMAAMHHSGLCPQRKRLYGSRPAYEVSLGAGDVQGPDRVQVGRSLNAFGDCCRSKIFSQGDEGADCAAA